MIFNKLVSSSCKLLIQKMNHLNYTTTIIILLWTLLLTLLQTNKLVGAMLPFSLSISKNSGGCCSHPYGRGGGGGYSNRMGGSIEAFDDGTPLSFYREQVAKIYGMGKGGGGGYMRGGGRGGGHGGGYGGGGGHGGGGGYGGGGGHGSGGGHGGGGGYGGGGGGYGGGGGHGGGGGRGGGGGGGYMKGGGGRGGKSRKMATYQQLFKNSLRYPNIMMGGGFMKPGDSFGPFGKQTSKKWKGYGKFLLKKIKNSGGQYGEDKLTFVQVVPSGATDEYKDSYVTLIADSMKNNQQQVYNY